MMCPAFFLVLYVKYVLNIRWHYPKVYLIGYNNERRHLYAFIEKKKTKKNKVLVNCSTFIDVPLLKPTKKWTWANFFCETSV